MNNILKFSTAMVFVCFNLNAATTGKILDATIKDKTLSGAEVIFQKTGETSIKTSTDSNGVFNADTSFDTNSSDVNMIVNKPGYSTLVVKCPCDNLTYALSPTMNNIDGLRVVLNWGSQPLDLDSHLIYPNNHIFYREKQGSGAELDVDDTDGYGPETITIAERKNGERYIYGVHDFSNRENSSSNEMSKLSDAKVFVYAGSTLLRTYYVPKNETGNLWTLFYLDESGELHDVNRFARLDYKESSTGGLDETVLRRAMESHIDAGSNMIITDSDRSRSKRLNIEGESAYASGNIEESKILFLESVSANPENAQAYSNLGLVFIKLDNNAEALWANRKSISLASGSSADRVKASSYYNIGKIYEKEKKYADALGNYEKAESHKSMKVYQDAIERVKPKATKKSWFWFF